LTGMSSRTAPDSRPLGFGVRAFGKGGYTDPVSRFSANRRESNA
jgi:hypothetical protein